MNLRNIGNRADKEKVIKLCRKEMMKLWKTLNNWSRYIKHKYVFRVINSKKLAQKAYVIVDFI